MAAYAMLAKRASAFTRVAATSHMSGVDNRDGDNDRAWERGGFCHRAQQVSSCDSHHDFSDNGESTAGLRGGKRLRNVAGIVESLLPCAAGIGGWLNAVCSRAYTRRSRVSTVVLSRARASRKSSSIVATAVVTQALCYRALSLREVQCSPSLAMEEAA